jgi:hypothetical protein
MIMAMNSVSIVQGVKREIVFFKIGLNTLKEQLNGLPDNEAILIAEIEAQITMLQSVINKLENVVYG